MSKYKPVQSAITFSSAEEKSKFDTMITLIANEYSLFNSKMTGQIPSQSQVFKFAVQEVANSLEWNFADKRPSSGQEIEVKYPGRVWLRAIYYDDGIDGIVKEFDGEITEIEEYGNEMAWRIG